MFLRRGVRGHHEPEILLISSFPGPQTLVLHLFYGPPPVPLNEPLVIVHVKALIVPLAAIKKQRVLHVGHPLVTDLT